MDKHPLTDPDDLPTGSLTIDPELAEELFVRGLLELSAERISDLEVARTFELPVEMASLLELEVEDEWMPSLEAVHWLAPQMGGDASAKAAIAERLRDGAIRCGCLWLAEGPDIGVPNQKRPTVCGNPQSANTAFWATPVAYQPGMRQVGTYFWRHSDDWERDQKRWDWSTGFFITCSQQSPLSTRARKKASTAKPGFSATRMLAARVRFHRRDIESIVGGKPSIIEPGETVSAPVTVGATRGRKRSAIWNDWIAELVAYIESTQVDWERTARDIQGDIAKRFSDPARPCLDYDVVEKTLLAIKKRMQKAKNAGEV